MLPETLIDPKERVLELLPQKKPFRFLDKIQSISDEEITGEYTFKKDEFFYSGHFPGNPVTPGVILLETMAQTGVVALGIYLSFQNNNYNDDILTFFTEAEVEFLIPIFPEETVTIVGKKIFFRHNKLKSYIELKKSDGRVAACGTLSGMGVKKS